MQVEVPVQIIVKCPFLALRYPKAANNVCMALYISQAKTTKNLLGSTRTAEIPQ
jgi:hypothetical protein